MPGGRPTEYSQEMTDKLYELADTLEGPSKVELALELGVAKQTLHNWSEQHDEFLDALTYAMEKSQLWWEAKGRENLEAQSFQSSMWSRSMAARFPDDWREKSEVKQTVVHEDALEQLK